MATTGCRGSIVGGLIVGGGGGQLSYLALGFATIDPSVITWGGSIVGGSIVGGSIVAVPFKRFNRIVVYLWSGKL